MTSLCCDKCKVSVPSGLLHCGNYTCECHLVSAWELPDDPLEGSSSYVELNTPIDILEAHGEDPLLMERILTAEEVAELYNQGNVTPDIAHTTNNEETDV